MKKVGLVLALAFAACGGSRPKPTADTTPSWLSEGNGPVVTEGGRQIHAIGVAQGKSSKERRQQADQKALALLSQTMDQLYSTLARSSELNRDTLPDEVKTIGNRAAADTAKIMDHYVTPDGTESALAVLDVDAYKQALQRVEGDDRLKIEISNKLDRTLDQLAKQ